MFDLGKWNLEIIEAIGAYSALQEMVTDSDTLKYYESSLEIMSFRRDDYDNSEPPIPPSSIAQQLPVEFIHTENHESLQEAQINKVMQANSIYRKQMLVLATTYIDEILLDFWRNFFITNPKTMYNYLNDGENNDLSGKIEFKDMLSFDTKEDFIIHLAGQATGLAMKGKFKANLNKFKEIAKTELNFTLRENLIEIVLQRNSIVHENSKEIVTNQFVVDTFDHILNFLGELGKIARDKNVPYVDPSRLID